MTTADSLFALARAAIPDPRNPRTGDTYMRPASQYHPGTVICVIGHSPGETRVYVAGQYHAIERFDLYVRSMPDTCPVASETCPVDLPT